MERVKVQLPGEFPFSTNIRIRITDLNYGGHVGNDSFLSLVHEARQQFLHHFGYSEMNVGGVSLIMADVAIEYKAELNYGNEVKISVAAGGFDRLGFDIYYLLEIITPDKMITAGKVKTGMLCFDYQQKKKVAVPAEAIERMTK
ncbi:acyl-CoA thioesterase [Aridibaculum aurantiacum]|uniref:acyl-CoA thioesterase n=1 Tax=Aridibaculum aurantiacum TaxID=2810307 RepID=UPI001A979E2A|nr:thioesterase family protein [Aridibaculum aurantiacum]